MYPVSIGLMGVAILVFLIFAPRQTHVEETPVPGH
jgi:hypothetical protein